MEWKRIYKNNGELKFDGECIDGKRTAYVNEYDRVNEKGFEGKYIDEKKYGYEKIYRFGALRQEIEY